jgi:hypothetical protein
VVFLVQLDELEGSAGTIAFLFGETIPLVKAAFAMLKLVSTASCFVISRICTFF